MNAWDLIKKELRSSLTGDSYQNWVMTTEFSRIQDYELYVTVPNEETRVWMTTEYAGSIRSAMRALGLNVHNVTYELAGAQVARPTDSIFREDIFDASRTLLNPRFTFDSFVVGSCNQFAHAAAQSVATSPSRRY